MFSLRGVRQAASLCSICLIKVSFALPGLTAGSPRAPSSRGHGPAAQAWEHRGQLSHSQARPFYPPLYASHFCNFLNDLIEFYFEVNSTFCMQYSEVMYFYF